MRVGAVELHASGGRALDHGRESTYVAGATPRGRKCRDGSMDLNRLLKAAPWATRWPEMESWFAAHHCAAWPRRRLVRTKMSARSWMLPNRQDWHASWPACGHWSVSKGRLQPDGQESVSLRFLREMQAILASSQRNRTRGWRHRVCTVRIEDKRPSKRSPSYVDQRLAAFASRLHDLSHRLAVGWRAGPDRRSQGLLDRLGLRHRVSVRLCAGH